MELLALPIGAQKDQGASDDADYTKRLHYVPTNSDGTLKIREIEGIWCVLNCWSGKEFSIERNLRESEIGCFLPCRDEIRVYKVRDVRYAEGYRKEKRRVTVSHYPTYLFAAYRDDCERAALIELEGIDNIIDVHETDQSGLIDTIASLQISYTVDPFMHKGEWQKPGKRVRVKAGAFMGAVGEIAFIDGQARLHVGIRTLGQPVELSVDPSECEPWEN